MPPWHALGWPAPGPGSMQCHGDVESSGRRVSELGPEEAVFRELDLRGDGYADRPWSGCCCPEGAWGS